MTTEPTELALITVHFARENLQDLDLLANIFGAMTCETVEDQARYTDALDSAIARDPEFAGYWLE